MWAHAEAAGCPYTAQMLVNETGLVISGGAETTRTVISRGLAVLAEHPDQWEAMAADPSLVPGAVEELIRWVTPLNNFFRTATADAEVAGIPVAAGDRFLLAYPSANRDERVFDRPRHVRHPPPPEPAHRLRVRHPLLPRRLAGPLRAHAAVHRADPALHRPAGHPAARHRGQHLRRRRPLPRHVLRRALSRCADAGYGARP